MFVDRRGCATLRGIPEVMKMGAGSILIRGGEVVTAESVAKQDVLVQGERIAAIGESAGSDADTVLDAGGLLVLP